MRDRAKKLGLDGLRIRGYPVTFWDVFGEQGHPVRATVSEMGPLLLAPNAEPQRHAGRRADARLQGRGRQGLLLLDMKDLRAMLQYVGDHAAEFQTQYGNVSAASIGAIQRELLALEHRVATSSSASPRSTSMTAYRPTPRSRRRSTFSPPTS